MSYADPRHREARKPLARVEIVAWAAADADLDEDALGKALEPFGVFLSNVSGGHRHHWVPRREGTYGGQPSQVLGCESCEAEYRNGEVVWP